MLHLEAVAPADRSAGDGNAGGGGGDAGKTASPASSSRLRRPRRPPREPEGAPAGATPTRSRRSCAR